MTANSLKKKRNACFYIKKNKNTRKSVVYNTLESHSPIATAVTPITMLNIVYKENWKIAPVFKKECPSNANVEKVVKPPQNPVESNNTWFWDR